MRKSALQHFTIICLPLLVAPGCGQDAASGAGREAVPQTTNGSGAPDAPLYSWVDRLNVRSGPSSTADVVAKADARTALRPTGKVSDLTEAVVLRGGLYEAPWREVALEDGTRGWVFGGAVQPAGGPEATPAQQPGVLDLEHFGRFDLSEWRDGGTKDISGEEMDAKVVTYRKADRRLELEESSMGEMYYGTRQTLRDGGGQVLRQRGFTWTSDPDGSRLRETVIDREGDRPRAFRREQIAHTHFYQLSESPSRATGAWEEIDLAEAERLMPIAMAEQAGGHHSLSDERLAPVVGRWRLRADDLSVLVIRERTLQYLYSHEPVDEPRVYRRSAVCPEEAGGRGADHLETAAYLVIEDGEAERCLYIARVTADELELGNVGRGNTLRYLRESPHPPDR